MQRQPAKASTEMKNADALDDKKPNLLGWRNGVRVHLLFLEELSFRASFFSMCHNLCRTIKSFGRTFRKGKRLIARKKCSEFWGRITEKMRVWRCPSSLESFGDTSFGDTILEFRGHRISGTVSGTPVSGTQY